MDNRGRTALMMACLNNEPEMVRSLLAFQASANTQDRTGNTCLTAACTLGYAEVTGLLLEASACANMRGPGGCKPLLCAIFEGQADIASLLLEAGACINSRAPHSSRTALTVSLLHGHTDIVRLLQDDRWEINTDSEGVGDEEDCEVD